MSIWPDDYIEKVLDDVEKNKDKTKIVKAGLIERCSRRSCSPEDIHPNPEDEFTHSNIGPNFQIINSYIEYIKKALACELPIFDEPLIVEKIESGGYRLLNGHHRWFAALRLSVKKVRIQIVNLVHNEDIHRMLEKTTNTKRVAFDLDEVLLSAAPDNQEAIIDTLFERRIKERLRKGALEVIKEFHDKGYDVWVYTAGYNSEEYINNFFSMYELEIEGVINGVNEKRKSDSKSIDKIIEEKYTQAVHVDNESVLFIDSASKSYEQYDIFKDKSLWSEGVVNILANVDA